jgi:putative transposase
MVSPAQRRAGVVWATEAYRLPQRRACRAMGVARSTVRYKSVRPPREPLRKRLRELASVRVSYGYRRLHVLLRREGWPINRKLVERLYREEGLTLRRKRPKRRKSAVRREAPGMPSVPDERWAMDFVHDSLAGGGSIRVLTVLDVLTRECVALEAGVGFRGEDVARILTRAGEERKALPALISVDNGTEFTSRALDHWAYWNHVKLDFSRPGKPTDNAHIEAFNASLRRECLSQHWFLTLEDAQGTLNLWKDDYNNARPHSSLGHRPPTQARGGGYYVPSPERLPHSQF